MPSKVKVKVQIGNYSINNSGYLYYCGKLWVLGASVLLEIEYKVININKKQRDILRIKLI